MRESAGARGRTKPSKAGRGWIHVHDDVPIVTHHSAPVHQKPAVKLVPIEVRNAIYRELIRISPASRYRRQLIHGPNGLLSRGLLIKETANYGALPASQRERARLARALRSFAKSRFPDFANLIGIPGVWQDDKGFTQIWESRDYRQPMLVIPYKDQHGRIHACQLRLHPDDIPPDEKNKYRWLSMPTKPRGCSSGTPIHFTFNPDSLAPGATVAAIEGALKADTLVSLRPHVRAIATSGVSCAHQELINAARQYHLLIGFDADYRTNPAVCMQLASLIADRELDQRQHQLSFSTRVLSWEGYKGIDDAALHNAPISIISIRQWFDSLSIDAQIEVSEIWREVGYVLN